MHWKTCFLCRAPYVVPGRICYSGPLNMLRLRKHVFYGMKNTPRLGKHAFYAVPRHCKIRAALENIHFMTCMQNVPCPGKHAVHCACKICHVGYKMARRGMGCWGGMVGCILCRPCKICPALENMHFLTCMEHTPCTGKHAVYCACKICHVGEKVTCSNIHFRTCMENMPCTGKHAVYCACKICHVAYKMTFLPHCPLYCGYVGAGAGGGGAGAEEGGR